MRKRLVKCCVKSVRLYVMDVDFGQREKDNIDVDLRCGYGEE